MNAPCTGHWWIQMIRYLRGFTIRSDQLGRLYRTGQMYGTSLDLAVDLDSICVDLAVFSDWIEFGLGTVVWKLIGLHLFA